MSTLPEDIQAAVSKHLPQALGEELQKRLKKADEDALRVQSLQKMFDDAEKQKERLNLRIEGLEKQLKQHAELADREKAVDKREHDADLTELKIRLDAEQSKNQFAKDVALGLVRNVEYRNSVFENTTGRAMPVPMGSSIQHAYQPENTTTTTTKQAT